MTCLTTFTTSDFVDPMATHFTISAEIHENESEKYNPIGFKKP